MECSSNSSSSGYRGQREQEAVECCKAWRCKLLPMQNEESRYACKPLIKEGAL